MDAQDKSGTEGRLTLAPPELAKPAPTVLQSEAPPPLERLEIPKAEEAHLRARASRAHAAGDDAAELSAQVALARWLAARDRGLEEAAQLALRTLRANDDPELRTELATWLEGLGDAGLAAAMLRPAAAASPGQWVRVGLLHARAGDATGAAEAFEESTRADPVGTVALELRATLSAWADDVVSVSEAAKAYVEAATRRAAKNEDPLEDLLRAFECDPSSEDAVNALAGALTQAGRGAAADEIRREHARALGRADATKAAKVHGQRRRDALVAGDVPRALGAALDEGLDARLDAEASVAFQEVLVRAGLHEALAARIEAAVDLAEPKDKGRLYETLARLSAGPLAQPARAAAAYAELVLLKAGKAGGDEARAALSQLATSHARDAGPLLAVLDAPDPSAVRSAVRECFGHPLGASLEADVEARLERARDARIAQRFDEAHEATRALASKSPRLANLAWVNAALAGDMVTTARAMERVAEEASAPVKTVLLAVASERLLDAGDQSSARSMAELACQNDLESARAVMALAAASAGLTDRTTASALERAVRLVCPRGVLCGALAHALEALGESGYAVAWSQQHVTLRPGDLAATQLLVDRVVRAKDASRLADTILWVLGQPQPATTLATSVANALAELSQLDPSRGAVVARRVLEAFGPRNGDLRASIVSCAMRAGDVALGIAVTERWIGAGAPAADRRGLLLELADRYREAADVEGEARSLCRALREDHGAAHVSDAVVARMHELAGKVTSGDGRLAIDEALAILATGKEPRRAVEALRAFGGALWDAADDPEGAIRAWIRAAELAGNGGYRMLTLDLARFSSADHALSRVSALAEAEPTANRAGAIASDAARAALLLGEPWRAFQLAELALARSPEQAHALESAEQGAVGAHRVDAMSPLYDTMGARALGRYGRRAAHYRGARFFEQQGEPKLALKHASEAFLAVPSEGATLMLLSRIARRAGDFAAAVRTIETVAELSRGPSGRAAWLLRAARAAGPGEEGARRRVDILLRAALLDASVATLAYLRDAVRELLAASPEEVDAVGLRIANASRMLTANVEGPDGARAAIAMSRLALDPFEDGDGALSSLERAMSADADLDEYAELVPHAPLLARARAATRFMENARGQVEKPYSNVGLPVLKLLIAIARVLRDAALVDRFAIYAAMREPEEVALVREADAAAKRLGDKDLSAKLDKKIPPDERAEMLGARISAPSPAKSREELAKSDEVLPEERARHWANIAATREAEGEMRAAAEALVEAAMIDPEPLDRWIALERAAGLASAADLRVLALREMEVRASEDARVPTLRRLAAAHLENGERDGAFDAWRKVLELVPDDDEADHALEGLIREANDYEALAKHLAWRTNRLAQFAEHRDALRAVRFRRAAILEQRLGRSDEAAGELERLLEEWPDNVNALRYLADLYERTGKLDKMAPLWRRLSELTRGAETKVDLGLRAVLAMRDAGDSKKALAMLKELIAKDPGSIPHQQLRAELARDARDDVELGQSLSMLADATQSSTDKSAFLVEAAQAAARVGDATMALAWARRAAEAEPTQAATQLFARGMEYRARGAGSLDEAKNTVNELGRIVGALDREDEGLRTFLVAEALTTVGDEDESIARLSQSYASLGPHPLVALALGERMLRRGDHAAALPLLEVGLSGSLLGFRSRGVVALSAADAAVRCERPADALRLLEEATFDEDTRTAALRRIAQIASSTGDVARSRAVLLELARGADPRDRPATLAQLGRLLFESTDEREHAEGERAFREAISLATDGTPQRAQLVAELESLLARAFPPPRPGLAVSVPPPSPPEAAGSAIPAASPAPADFAAPTTLADLEAAIRDAKSPEESVQARRALARAHLERGATSAAEAALGGALAEGSIEAGDELAELLEGLEGRYADLLRVRRAQVDLAPGDLARLGALREAALLDRNPSYARAVEHVARAFDAGAGPLPTPPLTAQVEQPGVLALLAGTQNPLVEAMGLTWEAGSSNFTRDPGTYSLTGLEHVEPGGASPLTRLYEIAVRLLDLPRVPLYLRRGTGQLVSSVALLSPAAAVLTGDVKHETPELRHALGYALSSALPQNALLLGLPEHEGRAVLRALLGAFGPPEFGRELDLASGRLAEALWRTLPGTAQRRLQDLLRAPPADEYTTLVEVARQSCRRVAFFMNGDFAFAVSSYMTETAEAMPQQGAGMLAQLCARHPAVADLLRLATRPEYADARWRPAPAGPASTHPSTGRFRFSRP